MPKPYGGPSKLSTNCDAKAAATANVDRDHEQASDEEQRPERDQCHSDRAAGDRGGR